MASNEIDLAGGLAELSGGRSTGLERSSRDRDRGKQVFTELSEIVDPAHTALLVVDMQRDFCCADGSFDRLGVDISMYPPVIERIGELLDGARQAGRAAWSSSR